MRCTRPRTVGFKADGKTISWSPKNTSKEFATFQLPCGKCISCRLEYARQWAVRCIHEAQMHENNSFITLTYNDENLKSDKLIYSDFQNFQKKLRALLFQNQLDEMFPTLIQKDQRKLYRQLPKERQNELYEKIRISIFVTGEYGDKRKRPHWHALIFNWRPDDCLFKYSNDRGDQVFSSATLDSLWQNGISEVGSVTFESAGYCARYAAKKLAHGKDQDHGFHPISKKSSKHAIGKSFLEKFSDDIFNLGKIALPNGKTCSIPRYYEKWLSKHSPEKYKRYVTQLKQESIDKLNKKIEKERVNIFNINMNRKLKGPQVTQHQAREIILEQKFKTLQDNLKL